MKTFSLSEYHKPAFYSFAGIASGILISQQFFVDHSLLAQFSCYVFILLIATSLLFLRKKYFIVRNLSLILSTILFGCFLHSSTESLYEHSLLRMLASSSKSEVAVYGDVISAINKTDYAVMYSVETDSITIEKRTYHITEKLALQLPFRQTNKNDVLLFNGDKIKAFGTLRVLERKRNPYQIDYSEKLRQEHAVDAILYLNSHYDYYLTHRVEVPNKSAAESVHTYVSGVLSSVIADTLAQGLLKAVLIGESNTLPPETWQEFNRAGLTHILVVSGFNLGLVALCVYYLLRLLRIHSRIVRSMITLLIVVSYVLVVGGQPSILRAAIVVFIFLAARVFERKPDLLNITAAAACINLIINPNELFNIGFQLSYGAVFSLAVLAPQLDRLFLSYKEEKKSGRSIYQYCISIFFGTLAVFIGTLPILIYHYQQVSIIGLFTNILIIPMSGLITILGMLLLLLSCVSTYLTSLYADCLFFLVNAVFGISHIASSLPFAMITLPRPNPLSLLLYSSVVIYCITSLSKVRLFGRIATSIVCNGLVMILNVPVVSAITDEDALTIVFFDVGQGDAALISTPKGKNYMVDFGGRSFSGRSHSERCVLPFLRAESIRSIDAAFVTHMHYDHYAGLEHIIKSSDVNRIYVCGERSTNQTAYTLDSISYHEKIAVETLQRGTVLDDGTIKFYILSPEKSQSISVDNINHSSIVMKVVYGKTSFLFMADAEGDTEREIVRQYGSFLKSDVVKVAHHGSKHSSIHELVGSTTPSYAVVSVGDRNAFGHPNIGVLERWHTAGASVLSTAHNGAIIFQSDGKTIKQVNWK